MGSLRVNALHRIQYARLAQNSLGYNTTQVALDGYFSQYNSGIGLVMTRDQYAQGLLSQYRIEGAYAYQLNVTYESGFRFGLGASYQLWQLDENQLIFADQIDAIKGIISGTTQENLGDLKNKSSVNFNIGASYFNRSFFIGAGVKNILSKVNAANNNALENNRVYFGQIGLKKDFSENTSLFLSANTLHQYDLNQIIPQIYWQFNIYGIGSGVRLINYREIESAHLLAAINLNVLRITYSYDIGINQISNGSGGAHEIQLRFLLHGDDNTISSKFDKDRLRCFEVLKN